MLSSPPPFSNAHYNMPKFHLYEQSTKLVDNEYYLKHDSWDDWFKFSTLYHLYFVKGGRLNKIGAVKIGQKGLDSRNRESQYLSPDIPHDFDELSADFFSIGQDEDYYYNLGLTEDTRKVLIALRDCAYTKEIRETYENDAVYYDSLMRFIDGKKMELFQHLANGNGKKYPFDFKFQYQDDIYVNYANNENCIDFSVNPNDILPGNIHTIIGSNGVGKTFLLLQIMERLYTESEKRKNKILTLVRNSNKLELANFPFSKILYISFSAFDRPVKKFKSNYLDFEYVGFCNFEQDEKMHNYNDKKNDYNNFLEEKLINSLENCFQSKKWERIKQVFGFYLYDITLRNIFEKILEIKDIQTIKGVVSNEYRNLSSGHSVLLIILVRLVELVEQRTLIIIDEPESHLHPPLLSTFIRSLSWLLINRNSMAIIATHSPVVLQEVPKKCVWIIERSDNVINIRKPRIETFGENIGLLMNEVFKLEIEKTGYVSLIRDLVESNDGDYRKIIKLLDNSLGEEAKAILYSLCR